MYNKICKECAFWRDGYCSKHKSIIPSYLSVLKCKMFELKGMPPLFETITASPEVLAPKLVYVIKQLVNTSGTSRENPGGYKVKTEWFSTILVDAFDSMEEAITATVAKLKEVEQ